MKGDPKHRHLFKPINFEITTDLSTSIDKRTRTVVAKQETFTLYEKRLFNSTKPLLKIHKPSTGKEKTSFLVVPNLLHLGMQTGKGCVQHESTTLLSPVLSTNSNKD